MGGGKKESSKQASGLGSFSRSIFNEMFPLRDEMNWQGMEALATGGVGAHMPFITRAMDQSRGKLAEALQGTTDEMAKHRLVGTPLGQERLATARAVGEQEIAGIPAQFTQDFISMLPNFLASMSGTGMQGMGQAAGNDASMTAGYNNAYSQILSSAIPKTGYSFAA